MSVGLIIAMTLRQWGHIDACLDDDANVETVDGDPRRAELARDIRGAGADQLTRETPGVPGARSWPPPDTIVRPKLTIAQWLLTIDVLESWAATCDRMGHHDTAARRREVRELILARLRAHGVRPPGDGANQ
ncbi:hypothetical protein HII36_48850 [Nonomuraea sp. NN258]|uniref:hypothetical protein n=1 Tax=Nonomuraea antri TaxID=2730852 RepID=UPI001569C83D|nr:hypothetical protein [Nonomuraea antri]NRQ39689.1 hypothetical protein [Nonomuraea antri]